MNGIWIDLMQYHIQSCHCVSWHRIDFNFPFLPSEIDLCIRWEMRQQKQNHIRRGNWYECICVFNWLPHLHRSFNALICPNLSAFSASASIRSFIRFSVSVHSIWSCLVLSCLVLSCVRFPCCNHNTINHFEVWFNHSSITAIQYCCRWAADTVH